METKTIKGKIITAEFDREGVTGEGKRWVMYKVLIDDEEFKTFDSEFLDKIGEEGEWVYKEEERVSKKGTPYTSKTLIIPKGGTRRTPLREYDQGEAILNGLGVIRGDISKLDKKIDALLEGTGVIEEKINVSKSSNPERQLEWETE